MKTQMTTFDLLFGLQLSMKILKITDNLSKILQKQSMSAAEGQTVAELTVKTLKSMRTDVKMLSLVYVTVSMSAPIPTFQHCHGKEKHLGGLKLELRKDHTVLQLRTTTVKHTLRYLVWLLQASQIGSISLVMPFIATLKICWSVQLMVKHLMICLLKL